MKIVSTSQEIKELLINLIGSYQHIRFAVAWASANHEVFKLLQKNKSKIVASTVGLHFYQTHPNFIENFLDSEIVKFVKNKNGVFHPKIYLFYNDNSSWACLIGSANFTKSALADNDEIMTFIESGDIILFQNIEDVLNSYFKKANSFIETDLPGYKNMWEQTSKLKKRLDDKFETEHQLKPLYKSSILSLNWNDYYKLLVKDKYFNKRLLLLDKAREYFARSGFKDMTEEERKNIAGINKNEDGIADWRLFGGMNMARLFTHRVNDKKNEISKSLEFIDTNRRISENNYLHYIEYFKEAPSWGYGISTTSRLLAMKRPDEFFCLTNANQSAVMEGFGIKKEILKSKDYQRYWNEIMEPIKQSPWYNSEAPSEATELKVWKGRVAMMDALFYDV